MNVLLTGGAGYIGSHVALRLLDAGHSVTVYDNLSTGFKEAVPASAAFVQGEMSDSAHLTEVMKSSNIEFIMHFAASTSVPQSIAAPLDYYRNNLANTVSLLEACCAASVRNIIFSSTAAVYGSNSTALSEAAALAPASPYGASKLFSERVIADAASAFDLQYIIFRYFNVAGTDPMGRLGQLSPCAAHLIRMACRASLGLESSLHVYGTDYDTEDGTCVRDFIHVSDLAEAHTVALDYMRCGGRRKIFNVGYGRGYSVKSVIDTLEKETGKRLNVEFVGRRPGDTPFAVADPSLIMRELNWKPQYDDLALIIRTTLQDEQSKLA